MRELISVKEQIASQPPDIALLKEYFDQPELNFKDQPLQELTWKIPGLSDDVTSTVGFCWNDFVVSGDRYDRDKLDDLSSMLPSLDPASYRSFIENYCIWEQGRGIAFGELLTKRVLSFYSGQGKTMQSILRGHQHNHSMSELAETVGCFNLWDGTVLTFFSAPEMGFRPLDSFSILTTAAHFEDWKITDIWRNEEWKTANVKFNAGPTTSILTAGRLD